MMGISKTIWFVFVMAALAIYGALSGGFLGNIGAIWASSIGIVVMLMSDWSR